MWGDLADVDEGWMGISLRAEPWLEREADGATRSLVVHVVRFGDLNY